MNTSFKKHGFTLIEMMVSVAIFTVIMTVTAATYLNISDVQRKANAIRAINDNVNFAMEVMTREISQGKDFNLANPGCSYAVPCGYFDFRDKDDNQVTYSLQSNSIKRTSPGDPDLYLTSSDVVVNGIKFMVMGQESGDGLQPMVTIIINAEAGEKLKIKTSFNLQTTITQRISE